MPFRTWRVSSGAGAGLSILYLRCTPAVVVLAFVAEELSILYLRCKTGETKFPELAKAVLSILYLRCTSSLTVSSPIISTFNSLFEMRSLRDDEDHQRKSHFQFSI